MLVRKLRLYRIKAKMSLASCDSKIGINHNRMYKLETCISNFKHEEAEYLADFFKTSVDEITKLIDMDVVIKVGNRFGYVINRENISKEETEKHLSKIKNTNRKQRQFKLKKGIEKIREANKVTNSFKCFNQACLLNKNCMCDNPVVVRGNAPCYGRNKIQDKPKKQNLQNTKICFMADTVLKQEKRKHYEI